MKIKEGFVKRQVAGQNIVIALGEANKSFNGMINLNDSGSLIWDMLQSGCEREDIISAMLEEYDVEKDIVERDVDTFIESLKKANAIE